MASATSTGQGSIRGHMTRRLVGVANTGRLDVTQGLLQLRILRTGMPVLLDVKSDQVT
jgi:hypothetical protein